jgi:hypothetical protein
MNALNELKEYVIKTLQPGIVEGIERDEVIRLLAEYWGLLEGSGETNMDAYKLKRCEDLSFTPPSTIEFYIERHGGTALGSVYADIHYWTVDLQAGTATCNPHCGKRLVGLRDKPLKVGPLVDKILHQILDHSQTSEYLEWKSDVKVRVLISKIIPKTVYETTLKRKRRFRDALKAELEPYGWVPTGNPNLYERRPDNNLEKTEGNP